MSSVIDRTKFSQSGCDFIDDGHLDGLLNRRADAARIRDVIAKSMAKQPLAVEETAALLAADSPELIDEIFDAARRLKRDVYGNRIVIFAPLYIGNDCNNDCQYCAFRRSNKQVYRRTLDEEEIRTQVLALENKGHKRLILVFGDHPHYDAEFIAECVQHVYGTASLSGEIRRVSINAAPMDHHGYAIINAAKIATYQIFQETYHHETYRRVHPPNTRKADYLWRLDGVARAIETECDDVG
ncbi:MAG: radical SAM protein, partial [Thermoguttaceae bacterium]